MGDGICDGPVKLGRRDGAPPSRCISGTVSAWDEIDRDAVVWLGCVMFS